MIHYLNGIVEQIREDYIVLSGQGMGWRVQMPAGLSSRLEIGEGGSTQIFTYLHVREDVMQLFGFPTQEDEQLFEILLTVTGVGPKLSQTILSSITPDRFALAIMNQDVKTLTTVKGLGKKTAERLILELKDKLKAPEWLSGMNEHAGEGPADMTAPGETQAVLEALGVLGYPANEATDMMKRYYQPELTVEENIRHILRLAGQGKQRT